MRLSTLEPWIIAATLGLLAVLCGHVAGLCGHIADLIRLYRLALGDRPSAFTARHAERWREQRYLYWALAVSCATGALCFAAIALGWG